jgi:hypothetical protein
MVRAVRSAVTLSTLVAVVACASAGATSASSNSAPSPSNGTRNDNAVSDASARGDAPCSDCGAIPMPTELTRAVESRIARLKARGGDCSRYAAVLETSYRSGQITLRPFMWRVGTHLASGEAKPTGEMMLAREIDSLNVGVRTVDDVLWTMEHEAAHIAFDFASGNDASEDKANQTVRTCKG